MNDCLVTNQLADRIGRNVISALLGKELYEASGSPYLVRHLLLDGACLLLLSAAAYPLMVIKKWKKKKRTGRLAVLDAARHGLAPLLLLCLPRIVGVPMWVVWYFVRDLCIVLLISAGLLFSVGIYKFYYIKHSG